jgi:hypothetical protein
LPGLNRIARTAVTPGLFTRSRRVDDAQPIFGGCGHDLFDGFNSARSADQPAWFQGRACHPNATPSRRDCVTAINGIDLVPVSNRYRTPRSDSKIC